MFNAPFFAAGVARLPVIWDETVMDGDIPTACTDGKVIRWNPKDFDNQADGGLVTTLCEEVCHCLFGHLWRFQGWPADASTINQGCDHAVRLLMKEFSAIKLAQNKADPFVFPEPKDAYQPDPKFTGMSEEQIVRELMNRPRRPPGGGKSPGGGKGKAGASKVPQTGSSAHSMPSFGQFQVGLPGQTHDKALRNDWQNTLIQSVAAMKQRGDLPASIKRFVDELVSPRVPWPELLRSWLREQCAEDWDWRSPCLEMSDSGFILPSLKSERMGPVIFGSDWSGSTHNLIGLFHSEKQSALDSLRPERLIDIGFDTKVAWEKEYFPGDTILPEVACGGGTCFKDFFRHCSELSPPPKCAVVLTDMDGTMPDEHPPFPVIWCSTEKNRSAPFGQVIYVGD